MLAQRITTVRFVSSSHVEHGGTGVVGPSRYLSKSGDLVVVDGRVASVPQRHGSGQSLDQLGPRDGQSNAGCLGRINEAPTSAKARRTDRPKPPPNRVIGHVALLDRTLRKPCRPNRLIAYDIAVADLDVAIFTFTTTEKDAVRALLEPLLEHPTDWTLTPGADWVVTRTLPNSTTVQVLHRHIAAQGNVIASTEFARAADYGNFNPPDYFIVYGCCGAIDKEFIGQLFRVSTVSYLSLGAVSQPHANAPTLVRLLQIGIGHLSSAIGESVTEIVKVKNKWIVKTDDPNPQEPLGSLELRAGTKGAPGPLMLLTIPHAHTLATDKVIRITPAAQAPRPRHYVRGEPVYSAGEWTYGQGLAHCRDHVPGPILIEMETFGIASTMRALALDDRVLVLRVVTDALSNKESQTKEQQLGLLKGQLPMLAHVLATIMGIADDELQHI